jgi:nucleoside-triphosphatase THEP1
MFNNISVLSPEFDVPFEAYVIDRAEELNILSRSVLEKGQFIWICGRAGTGKTTLLLQFTRRYKDFFLNHRTDITFVYAREYRKVKEKLIEAIAKPDHQNTLLIIDESEHLSSHQLEEILNEKRKNDKLKLIFSSRKRPNLRNPEFKNNCHILNLKSPDLFSVLQKRLQLLGDKDIRNKARQIFNEYFHDIKQTDKTPREVLSELNRLIHDYPEAEKYIKKDSIEVEEDESGNIVAIKADYVGIIFALVLFLVSQFSAGRSEKFIADKIDGLKTTIESVVSIYSSENENLYFVNRKVNFRNDPSIKNSKILRVLKVNTVVTLIKREGSWMYVKYSDYVNDSEQRGWVYEKYLSKKAIEKNSI